METSHLHACFAVNVGITPECGICVSGQVFSHYENNTFRGLDWQGRTRRFTPKETWDFPRGSGEKISLRLLDPAP